MLIRSDKNETSGKSILRVTAPAKLNLYLEILGKRPDGYHELETVMVPIDLCDHLSFQLSDSPRSSLVVQLPDTAAPSEAGKQPAWDVPSGPSNLILKAVDALQRQLGDVPGIDIVLQKSIPAAAGLGGGSSDAAATVVACLALWRRWDRELALRCCHELGSDVAFFLGDPGGIGMMLAKGRGELCTRLTGQPQIDFLLSHPPQGCSTKDVYGRFRPEKTPQSPEKFLSACETGQPRKIGAHLFNALQSPAASLNPWIDCQLDLLRMYGSSHTLMTGSGSSCFALLDRSTDGATDQAGLSNEARAELFAKEARARGVFRTYFTSAWYTAPIEQQLQDLAP